MAPKFKARISVKITLENLIESHSRNLRSSIMRDQWEMSENEGIVDLKQFLISGSLQDTP